MPYVKQTWNNGDTITAEKLNHIEEGIKNAGGGSSSGPEVAIVHFGWYNSSYGYEEDYYSIRDWLLEDNKLVLLFTGTAFEDAEDEDKALRWNKTYIPLTLNNYSINGSIYNGNEGIQIILGDGFENPTVTINDILPICIKVDGDYDFDTGKHTFTFPYKYNQVDNETNYISARFVQIVFGYTGIQDVGIQEVTFIKDASYKNSKYCIELANGMIFETDDWRGVPVCVYDPNANN